ncbi:uncharacterized protein OCT59_013073 [Rhizophagus irregularis]|uniref:3CxxC-type domain-containing protein n=2 Tax=Rhizophagus irregularis TaxID=588596 RepID=U9SYB9_RHIID|nr:hypothetical protein GLOIN_2v1572487 [Rhizophagus irregularis DAOM 181602=DAOM 197198]EXX74821.1 hypothetical protein RirG_047480 [Rhizophagus irregularis DAOM 197198w]UZO20650.1 hypothetical protein OCT59_013073 [Rhizophagus irregularis]POG74712.1 hypothetical protein GLOIN_2v1572487 [Rhizophagus irregularis DAOM 181602=DAOM 197198]CAG8472886.1 20246_t:CDS:10 [Rhizophagus irregularis]GBC31690.1 hypothetical protein GLOIN_2v1572487 [Rhizophagus irregularis DAOM 181602=DAOM 197198]|eukprot:XP_025181578.1 hypothetical protein GLOIN_2v1572487 [Rhizophagus irregularis DAOM 181602=DAOM 197198]
MGQILSSVSGNEKASQKNKTSSPSSRQFSQYSQYVPQRKSESIFSTPQPSYDTEWLKIKIRKQEVERLRQAKQAREEEAERLRLAKKAREQEAERLKQARQAREQEAIKLYLARQQEKASQVSKNTTSLSNRSYNVVASSERKLTSGTNDNTTHVTITASGVTSGTKDNTSHRPSMDNKKTTSLGIKGNPTSFSDPYNISSKSEKNTTSLSKEDRENVKRITEIVRSILTRDKNYVVYGNWSCPHWPISCNNEYEWQYKYSLESLRSYLTLNQKSKKDVFMNKCKECDKESLVTSFFLYNRQPNRASKKPDVEIVCRLEWNNHYRVFAEWKCNRPQSPHEWKSSYTWILLRNYIEKSPLKKGDYYEQKCHDCREECKVCKKKPKEKRGCKECDHATVVSNHSQLVQSPGGKPHKRWLCAKCKGGSICRSDNNYRIPRQRNIELF